MARRYGIAVEDDGGGEDEREMVVVMSTSGNDQGGDGRGLMIGRHEVEAWVRGYRKAWLSNDPRDIRSLFAEEAVYYSEPYAQPQRGSQAIVDDWLARKDEPGDTTFEFEVMATTDELAFVRGLTTYNEPPRTYYNLWVIRLNETGECTEFTEWWMETDKLVPQSWALNHGSPDDQPSTRKV